MTTTAQWGDEMGRSAENTCCSPEDMADLIEYSWGDATTPWGKTRIADGHPEPYKIRYIELGNVSAPVTLVANTSRSASYS